jgi:aryl-phospho-beta-D-glucosidase BglC (GH1 family)
MIGVNLSGAEFGSGNSYGRDYYYAGIDEIRYYADRGAELIRFPFDWERMQPTLGGPLDATELGRLKKFLADAHSVGVKVIVDLHNYGRYDGKTIGSAGVSNAQFADFWQKLASAIKGSPALVGYGLMNEPYNMGGAGIWKSAAQAAVDAIRKVDGTEAIYAMGDGWGGAHSWLSINKDFILRDPANNIIYEAHQYFDRDSSGTYVGSYDQEGAYANVGVDRLKPFFDWLKANNLKGFIGEFGVPSNDDRWLEVQKRAVEYMEANGVSGTAWGGGFWWSKGYSMFMGSPSKGETDYFESLQDLMDDGDDDVDTDRDTDDDADRDTDDDADGGTDEGTDEGTDDVTTSPPPPTTTTATISNPTLVGTAGDDRLSGTPGVDRIDGREGNDVLVGTGRADVMAGGSGIDTVSYHWSGAGVNVDLTRATQLTGDAHGDTLIGIESVAGSAGSDLLSGDAGANSLNGNGGNDALKGRGGKDVLTGGSGSDRFIFDSASNANGDRVTDWRGGDVLDFSRIDANERVTGNQGFTNIGSGAFTKVAGQLRVYSDGDDSFIAGDVNGDGVADFTVTVTGLHNLTGLVL